MSTLWSRLVPQPQKYTATNESVTVNSIHVCVEFDNSNDIDYQSVLTEILTEALQWDSLTTNVITVSFSVRPHLFSRSTEEYRLHITPTGITIHASDGAGLVRAAFTLAQLFRLSKLESGSNGPVTIPCGIIHDWPSYRYRGVMLDVSRDKVPTMETMIKLIKMLASWKINQIQLYMEHTFAYKGHEIVWKDASPFTPEEIRALDDLCYKYHIELVPNQNSFGHFHRWLKHDEYKRYAEVPEGYEHPFSVEKEPFSLAAVQDDVFELLDDLYSQLLPNFRSNMFNVGCDETFDLGKGKSKEACKLTSTMDVYVGFLKKIHRLVRDKYHKTMQFWGDIIIKSPHHTAQLPTDVIALEWGYEDSHPFEQHSQVFASSGLSYYVCPGTSSWNSICGRTTNALLNLSRASIAGVRNNAIGYLITDWGDHGHIQPLPISYFGFLVGACFSWNVASAEAVTSVEKALDYYSSLLSLHCFNDRKLRLGRIIVDMGNLYLKSGFLLPNQTILFAAIMHAPKVVAHLYKSNMTCEHTTALFEAIDKLESQLQSVGQEANTQELSLVVQELSWCLATARLGTQILHTLLSERSAGRNINSLCELPDNIRSELRRTLEQIITGHMANWAARNRPGGLKDSVNRLGLLAQQLTTN